MQATLARDSYTTYRRIHSADTRCPHRLSRSAKLVVLVDHSFSANVLLIISRNNKLFKNQFEHHLKIRAKIEVREHLYRVSLRRRVYTIVHHFKNRERYWVSCGKLRTNSQHHDIVTTPFQKAVATKRFMSHLQARNTRYLK